MTHYFLRWLTQGWQASRKPAVVCHEARPPWAIEESQYLSLCTRCGECFKACPRLPKGANVQCPTDLAPFFHGPHRMTTDTTHQKLLDQLQQLEDELRSQSLWSAVAPSPAM